MAKAYLSVLRLAKYQLEKFLSAFADENESENL